jgi:DNA-binding NtrC family response regulator
VAHVIVVEDDEPYAYLIEKELRAAGHEVTVFFDWVGVLELVETGAEVSVLVTDLRLPQGTPNGHSLARLATKRNPSIKVVYMTAFADVAVEAMRTLPAVIVKGSDAKPVVAAVAAALAA